MSQDRRITGCKRKLDKAEVQNVLEDYVGGAGVVVPKEKGVWLIYLPGKLSFPFKRVFPDQNRLDETWDRVIGVHVLGQYVRITTDLMDEFTNNVADGLTALVVRFYEGKLEP